MDPKADGVFEMFPTFGTLLITARSVSAQDMVFDIAFEFGNVMAQATLKSS